MDETIGLKTCNVCNMEKPVTEFYFRKERNEYRSNCKKCKPLISKEQIAQRMLLPTKVCKHCSIEKPVSEYQKAGGGKWLQPYCKPCDAERKKKHRSENIEEITKKHKQYYQDNKEVITEKTKKYRDKNIDAVRKRSRAYREANLETVRKKQKEYNRLNSEMLNKKHLARYYNDREKYLSKFKEYRDSRTPEQVAAKKLYDRQYKKNNKEKYAKWRTDNIESLRAYRRADQAKRMSDVNYKLKKNLRSRLRIALKGIAKSNTTEKLLGCTIQYFQEHIQKQFIDGMSWDNYGRKGWHVDHKKPCAEFDLRITEEQNKCFHYSNLQPLWWYDNLKKGANYQEQQVA